MIFLTREQIRKYDEIAMVEYGMDGAVLMENAGAGAAKIILKYLENKTGSIAIVAGTGNNGGDGFVVARHLVNSGRHVRVFLAGTRDKLKGEAKNNFEIIVKMGVDLTDMPRDGDVEKLSEMIKGMAIVVDALFGTGLDREITGLYARVIEIINSSNIPVISLDVPSGIDADTGRPLGICVKAVKTITFAYLKRGLLIHPGVEYAGEIEVVDIGAPAKIITKTGYDGETIEENIIKRWISPRPDDSHKGSYGHVLIVAGSRGKTGAALMGARGALRSGSGLVTIAAQEEIASDIEKAKPVESMMECFSPGKPESLLKLMDGKSAVAFGPGCGVNEKMEKILDAIISECKVPLVIDADGLTLLSGKVEKLKKASCPVILTPHPGEMARLTGNTKEEIQNFRIPVSRQLAGRTGAIVILKGSRTVIASADGRIFLNLTGNPGMASGGMGDVLTGMIVSFCGQGYAPIEAACISVFVHGKAGDFAREMKGERGLIASDLVESIPLVLRSYELPTSK